MKVGIYSELVLVCVLAASALRAETLVVSQHDPRALDTSDGSVNAPLATITAAAQRVKPGDHVVVHGGEYRETVIITTSGTEASPIVFEAAPGETVVIKGSDVSREWKRDDAAVWRLALPAKPKPAGDKDPAFWRTNDVRQVFARDGVFGEADRLDRVSSRDAMRRGTFFCDKTDETLFVWLRDGSSPLDHPPEVALRGGWLMIHGDHVTVRGFQMRHASTTAIADWPAAVIAGHHISVEDCTITWGDFVGISLSGESNRLVRCTVAFNGDCGIGGTGSKHSIEGCRVIFNNTERYDPTWHAGGAKLIPAFSHSTVRQNEFAYNLGTGLWLDSRCDGNIIDANYAHDNEGAGIMVEISADNLVSNNVCANNRNFLSGFFRDSTGAAKSNTNSETRALPLRFGKVYHAGDGRGIYVSSAARTKVFYNTVYSNDGEGICVEGPPREDGGVTMVTLGSQVRNNISVFNRGSQLTIANARTDANAPAVTSDHNILFALAAVLAQHGWGGAPAYLLNTWQKSSEQDAHSFEADARFAATAMADFRPLEDSVAIGAAAPLDEVKTDFRGQQRDATKPTIGAFEAGADGETFSLLDPTSWRRGVEPR